MSENNVGKLLIELGVNAAGLHEGFDKATYKSKQAAREIGESMRGLGNSISGVLGKFGEVGGVIGEALAGAGETIAKFSGTMGSIGGAAGAAAIGISAIAAVAVGAVAAITEMALSGAELVHSLSIISQKTGISIGDLQGLQAAGATVGLSLDAMVIGFRKFDQALLGMGKGGGAAAVVLRNLGVTAMDNKEALNQVADAFSKMEDGPRKAADAVALFGRAGLNMIPFLNKGREGLAEFNKLVEEYGPKIGKDAVEANEHYLVSQVKMGLAWDAMKVSLVSGVLPVLTAVISALAEIPKVTRIASDAIFHHFGRTAKLFWEAKDAGDFHSKVAGAYENDPEVQAAKDNARIIAKTKEDATNQANKQEYAEKQIALAIKDQGKAATALRLEKEKIAELEQAGKWDLAAKEYPKLPAMEKSAAIEKQRLQYKLDPKETVLGPDKVTEANAKLDEAIVKQRALADATQLTTHEQVLAAAAAEEQLKINELARSLAEEQVKAEGEFARLKKESGTQAWHEAKDRLDFIKKERQELDASTSSMVQKAVAAARIADDSKLNKQLNDELNALNADEAAWELTTAAIEQNTAAKIEAAVAAARLREAARPGSTEASVDLAGARVRQRMEQDHADAMQKQAIQLDMHRALAQEMNDLDEIEAKEGKSLGTIYKRKEAIVAAQHEWDKEAMAVGNLNERIAAGLQELVLDGQDFWKKFEESGISAVQGMEGELAKLVTGSKTNFGQVAKQFEENFVKNGIQSIVSKGAQSLLDNTGLGDLIPGMKKKADGSATAPFYVQVVGGMNPLGSLPLPTPSGESGGGGLGGLFGGGFGGILSTVLSFLPGLAGGGDVTPGKAYVVGEDHPEFFVPSTPGTIHPSLKMGGSTQQITQVHIHGVTDMDSFNRSKSQVGQSVTNAVSRANSRR